MTILQTIGLIIVIPCIGLVCYLICKRLYQVGFGDGTEYYQNIWHKERLRLEVELRRIKKKHNLNPHPCIGCNQGWATDNSDKQKKIL